MSNYTIYLVVLLVLSLILVLQGSITIWQMIYSWLDEEKIKKNEMPKQPDLPQIKFSIIIPCRHEQEVIGTTLQNLIKQTYSKNNYEIIIPIKEDDTETIHEVKKFINKNTDIHTKLVIFNTEPTNKPHSLNEALKFAKGDYIVVFDAEDDVNPRLLDFINSTVQKEGRVIIQTGVALMNIFSNWYCLHGILEYYLWFSSRLHWYADKGIMTLGGVGIFIPKEIITKLGGWNDKFLTEDAKLGIDASVAGHRFRVLCEEKYSIKEEIPSSLTSFLKQRTRWIQGFLQILLDAKWTKLTFEKQIYFLTLILFPFFQIILYVWTIYSIALAPKLPLQIVFISLIPTGILIYQIAIEIAHLIQMLSVRKKIKFLPILLITFLITFLPYQIILSFSALRAVIRQIRGNNSWEKTTHTNSHRQPTPNLAPATLINYD